MTLFGPAIRVVQWGLDPISWIFCIIIGSMSLLIGLILKFIPLEKYLPGGGQKELAKNELDKLSSMTLRKKHDSKFFRQQSGIHKKQSSMIEDRKI